VVRILVVDDHPIFRHGLISVLEKFPDFQIVGEASDGLQSVNRARQSKPDVILMDVRMLGGSGVEGAAAIHELLPDIRVLMLTVSDEDDDLFGAMKAGAKGYLLKNIGLDSLVDAVRLVARGEVIISPAMADRLMAEFRRPGASKIDNDTSGLSPREKETLVLVAQGGSNKEIARVLFISETTVKAHLRSILEKLHVKNRAEAVARATASGLLGARN